MSSAPARTVGWLATMPDHNALDPPETDDDVFGERAMHLQEFAGIDDVLDDPAHVHRPLRIVGNQGANALVLGQRNVGARPVRRILGIVLRQEGQQLLDDADGVGVVLGEEMHVAGDGGVHVGAADLVHASRRVPVTALITSGPVMNI